MFEQILETLIGDSSDSISFGNLLGFFVNNRGQRVVSINENYGLDVDVFGLDVLVTTKYSSVTKYFGCAKLTDNCIEVVLTQHESGRNTIKQAVDRLLMMDSVYYSTATWRPVSAQDNVKRCIVTLKATCLC